MLGLAFPCSISSPAREREARFGTPIQFSSDDGFAIARFLRVLRCRDTRKTSKLQLIRLAEAEIRR
jgi:hypothetical protein